MTWEKIAHLFLTEDMVAPTPVEAFEPPSNKHHVPHPRGFWEVFQEFLIHADLCSIASWWRLPFLWLITRRHSALHLGQLSLKFVSVLWSAPPLAAALNVLHFLLLFRKCLTVHQDWPHYHNHLREFEDHMSTKWRRQVGELKLGQELRPQLWSHCTLLWNQRLQCWSRNQTGGNLDTMYNVAPLQPATQHCKGSVKLWEMWSGQRGCFRNYMWRAMAAA